MNQNNENNQNSEFSLPPLLSGSEYKTANSNICRAANLLGQAIAILIHAGDGKKSKSDKEALLESFKQECKRVSNHSNIRWHFSQIQAWLKASLSGKPDWNGLYKLVDHQVILFKKDHTKWWDDMKSICSDPDAGTETYDPMPDILKISQKYGKKKRQNGASPVGRKHGKGKLNEEVKNLVEMNRDWKSSGIAERIGNTSPDSVRQTSAWINRKRHKKERKNK